MAKHPVKIPKKKCISCGKFMQSSTLWPLSGDMNDVRVVYECCDTVTNMHISEVMAERKKVD